MDAIERGVWIRDDHWEWMAHAVERLAPEEACGLVAGCENRSTAIYPVENALHSPVRFRMNPQAQVDAILDIEARGWDLLGIYHSHPTGPEIPSPTDLAELAYPEAIYFIWSIKGNQWFCRGFSMDDQRHLFREVPIFVFSLLS